MITKAKLQGHGAAVLCLDTFLPSSELSSSQQEQPSNLPSSTSALLLSGSEDGTARLWDLRDHRRRACLCIRVPGGGDVLSAVFAPPTPNTTTQVQEENEGFSRNCSVYLGVENTVLEYDLRQACSPIISSAPTRDWGRVLQNQDEVNQVGLAWYSRSNNSSNTHKKKRNQKKKGGGGNKKRQPSIAEDSETSLFLAACDDAGKARWTEAKPLSPPESQTDSPATKGDNYDKDASSTILHHDLHGVAVVPACAFRPASISGLKRGGGSGGPSLELATGGTDCKIHLWDIFRPKKPISTFVINQNSNEDGQQSKPQVCNPPFVYSLAWSNNGKSLTAGLGDGTVGVFEINNRKLVQTQLLVGSETIDGTMNFAHESSVASVNYPSFSNSTSDRILSSAGSDGAIVFWDLGIPNDEVWDDTIDDTIDVKTNKSDSKINSGDAVAEIFPPRLLQDLSNRDFTEIHSTTNVLSHKPRILFDISHGEKINWVTPATPSGADSSAYNDTIFVADTSSDITSYTISF